MSLGLAVLWVEKSETHLAALASPAQRRPWMAPASQDFYVRYYVGHKGKFGHEFLEFEFRPDGQV